MTLASPQN